MRATRSRSGSPVARGRARARRRAAEEARQEAGGGLGPRSTTSSRSRTPSPTDCKPLPQKTPAGRRAALPRRGVVAHRRLPLQRDRSRRRPLQLQPRRGRLPALAQYKKPPVYGVSMYKLAWTYFKQQRYETSVAVRRAAALRDQQEKADGRPRHRLPREAYTYIAGSLTYLDFEGPAPDEPYIPRNDVLDTRAATRASPSRRCAWPSIACRTRSSFRRREVDRRGLQGARAGVQGAEPVPERRSR
jgi:hypothetical protein